MGGATHSNWAGALLDREQPIVLIAAPGRETEAAMRLGRIGFDHVVGYLQGGMQAVVVRPDLVRRTERVTAETLTAQLAARKPPLVLDVRMAQEWQESHIAGSLNIPLHQLQERLDEVPRGGKLVVHCQTGYRSSVAVSLLAQKGVTDVSDLVGGIVAWQAIATPPSLDAPPLSPQG
jgi:rhodanese-related sulfurtransferase